MFFLNLIYFENSSALMFVSASISSANNLNKKLIHKEFLRIFWLGSDPARRYTRRLSRHHTEQCAESVRLLSSVVVPMTLTPPSSRVKGGAGRATLAKGWVTMRGLLARLGSAHDSLTFIIWE